MEEEKCVEPEQVRPERVVVLGPGLMSANCNEEAEFIVDGSNAGPGKWLYKLNIRPVKLCCQCPDVNSIMSK